MPRRLRPAHSIRPTRTAMKRLLLPALFVVLLYPTCYGQSGDRVFNQTFPLRAGEEFSVATSSSDVIVRSGSGNEARVEVYGKGRDLDDAFERLRFSAQMEGDRLVVKTEREGNNWSGRNASFDIVLTVPERVDFRIATSSGDISLDALAGDGAIATSSGDIEARSVRGSLGVATSSGDFNADRIEGDVEFSTSSGDFEAESITGSSVSFSSSSGDFEVERIDADRFSGSTSSGDLSIRSMIGDAEFSSSSGDIEIGALEGSLAASTSSGDIEADLVKPGDVDVSTGSGGVRLTAPASLAADVDIRGGSIRIDREFRFAGEVKRRSAEGQIGGGGQQLKVRTGSGSVTLAAR